MRSSGPLVIVLEDEPVAAAALCLILQDWGAEIVSGVDEASARVAAGSRIAGARFIITDFSLSAELDGVSCARSLLKDALGARVLVLSASTHGRAATTAAAAGFDFMRKPADARAIIAWLEAR
jgi:DNA-binding response OmpR family regulator